MTAKFLKAKHWQLFLLTFGIPLVFQLIMFGEIGIKKTPTDIPFFPLWMYFFIGILYGWFWSIATEFQSNMPNGVEMKVKKFKILFFTLILYFWFYSSSLIGSTSSLTFTLIIVTLHLFSMFCMIYILYFVAKTIKTVELQRKVDFSDFAVEFILILFYPIGIWIIQPKINKLF